MELRHLAPVLALFASFLHAKALKNAYAIDTFENSTSLAHWHVSGPGSLRLGTGHGGSGALLTFRTQQQSPVTVTWTPSSPVPKVQNPRLSLWIRSSEDVEVTLQVNDARGKSMVSVPIEPSLEHPQEGEWQYVAVPIKKRLAHLGILIRSRSHTPVQGDVSFDEVLLSNGKDAFRLGPEQPIQARSSRRDLPIMGVNIHLLRDEASVDLARAAGFRFVRMDLLWSNVERRGRFRFFAYDLLVRQLEARNMGVVWILDYGHPDHGGGVPRSPEDIAAFSHFAEAVATHYRGRNVRYEIWNEPNNAQFWAPSPDPVEYAALLRPAVTAMRRADPSAIISSGGISNVDLGYLSRAVDRSFGPMLSAISIHPYPKNKPESIAPAYSVMRSWIKKEFGDAIELWDSEWGYSSTLSDADSGGGGKSERHRKTQAILAAREILTVWTLGFSLAVWYDLRDDGKDPDDPEQNYGLLDSDGHEKPAMQAVRHLMDSATNRKFMGMLPQPPPGVHAVRFEGEKDELTIVWTDVPNRNAVFECVRNNLVSVTDMMGKPLDMKAGSKGYLRIRIAENMGPVYVLFRAASRP
jgi:hypothetical protein